MGGRSVLQYRSASSSVARLLGVVNVETKPRARGWERRHPPESAKRPVGDHVRFMLSAPSRVSPE